MNKDKKCDEGLKESVSQIQKQLTEIKTYQSPFYDVKGESKFLGISARRLYAIISDGGIAYYRNKSKRIRFSKKQLEEYEYYKEFSVKDKHQ